MVLFFGEGKEQIWRGSCPNATWLRAWPTIAEFLVCMLSHAVQLMGFTGAVISCSHARCCVVYSINSEFKNGDSRFLITNAMHVDPSSVLEFELVMDCLHSAPQHRDDVVRLEYSTDHGMTWSLVLEGCYPPSSCSNYHSPSVYQAAEFPHWRRVTIILPLSTWSVSSLR